MQQNGYHIAAWLIMVTSLLNLAGAVAAFTVGSPMTGGFTLAAGLALFGVAMLAFRVANERAEAESPTPEPAE